MDPSTPVALRKTSLVDYPGRVSAVLFFPLCDFRCPYCHNAALVDPSLGGDPLATLGDFFALLDRRRGLLSGAVVSGGEPLLRPDLPEIAAAIRERGLALKLDTNGSFPDRIAAVAPDYVALDLKTAPDSYGRVAPAMPEAAHLALESLRLLRGMRDSGRLDYEIRLTCAPGVVEPADVQAMADLLEPGDRVFLQAFRPGGCLDPAWDGVEPYDAGEMAALLRVMREKAPLSAIRGA